MLEGRKVNLRVLERDDYPLLSEWFNKPEVFGKYNPLHQVNLDDVGKIFSGPHEARPFIVEDKEGRKVGFIFYFYVLHPASRQLEVGYTFIPSERGKGYGTEALEIMVDFIFLTKDAVRLQAQTDPRNIASQRILEKAGFKKDGVLRKTFFVRGEWTDSWVYSILREEWKGPRVLQE
ncbi:MAG TPA: GNAT family protein [Methanomassiliicoccales archaeon]|nr:GNAT family protein [Methanomassiliicoccales archaeon]